MKGMREGVSLEAEEVRGVRKVKVKGKYKGERRSHVVSKMRVNRYTDSRRN